MLFLLAKALGFGDADDPDVALVEVPNVVGDTLEVATTKLEGEGFEVDPVSEANDEFDEGIVFDQTPARGERIEEGSTVQVRVSAGQDSFPVPEVIGSEIAEARRLISESEGEFTVREEPTPDEEAPEGEVVDQQPGPGQEAPRGSEIVLFVSSGPEERGVPNVAGRSVTEASNILGQNGFTVTQTTESSASVPAGQVIRTDPPADTPQPKGAQITIVVSSGPAESTVPSVVGLSEANAIATLQGDGFKVTVSEEDTADQSEDGRVTATSPSANSTAPEGATVTIPVGRPLRPTEGCTTTTEA